MRRFVVFFVSMFFAVFGFSSVALAWTGQAQHPSCGEADAVVSNETTPWHYKVTDEAGHVLVEGNSTVLTAGYLSQGFRNVDDADHVVTMTVYSSTNSNDGRSSSSAVVGHCGPIVGTPGATGATGPTGPTGATGPTGSTGTQGAKGATGATGATGPTGTAGAKGDTGTSGSQGSTGTAGATGTKGDKGDAGAQGAQGDNGAPGANGSNGANGSPGAPGADGVNGASGTKGAKGAPGKKGKSGVTKVITHTVTTLKIVRPKVVVPKKPPTAICPNGKDCGFAGKG